MQYLKPSLQTYAWGSHSFIQDFLKLDSPGPLAEAWYGAHPKAPAMVGNESLQMLISRQPAFWLGPKLDSFPYLLKILAASQALSIQVHPSKTQAEQGFARENKLGIPLSDPTRNYQDDNHKPELFMALTDFHALCGFRTFTELVDGFESCHLGSFFAHYPAFRKNPQRENFARLYREILDPQPLPKLTEHIGKLKPQGKWEKEILWMQRLLKLYPHDKNIIAPLYLNLIELKPYEAIFLPTGIVHAYLKGAGIEIMACSDNVLRAGLSPKHIDPAELLQTISLEPYAPQLITAPPIKNQMVGYLAPVKDFLLARILLEGEMELPAIAGPRILLCLSGEAKVIHKQQELILHSAQSIIIPHLEQKPQLTGKAEIILAAYHGI